MKVRIYKPHTHAGKRHAPGPEGVEIDVSPQGLKFIQAHGINVPPSVPAIGAEPQAGEGSERRNVPAAGNAATQADSTTVRGSRAPADADADIPAPVGKAGTAAGGSVSVPTADPTVTRTVSPAAGAGARTPAADPSVTRTATPSAPAGKK